MLPIDSFRATLQFCNMELDCVGTFSFFYPRMNVDEASGVYTQVHQHLHLFHVSSSFFLQTYNETLNHSRVHCPGIFNYVDESIKNYFWNVILAILHFDINVVNTQQMKSHFHDLFTTKKKKKIAEQTRLWT
jgi:hypothetical protein